MPLLWCLFLAADAACQKEPIIVVLTGWSDGTSMSMLIYSPSTPGFQQQNSVTMRGTPLGEQGEPSRSLIFAIGR